ncbi:MAG: hypothetical protein B6244_00200 [Candidatus Cloacimonetes bacterium 4572_55]|nr:MAG: hypothetical protein B6244_00200 [Candidatus Cloacimonetes bacterium 4572_55]
MDQHTITRGDIQGAVIQYIKWHQELGLEELVLSTTRLSPDPESYSGKDHAGPVEKSANSERIAQTLEEHYDQICRCTKCPLHKTRTKFVYGSGNPNADLVFIGEAPGADEDKQGEPFVGAAGQLFDKILKAIDLTREEVYLCNIIKCRPPKNRDPRHQEIEICKPYLHKQLELIRPKLICALGRIAGQTLVKKTLPLRQLRNRLYDYQKDDQKSQGANILITYHPAALLYTPNSSRTKRYKREVWEDMKRLRQLYLEVRTEKK